MRKDRLSSYQAKKQKLEKIKDIITTERCEEIAYYHKIIYKETALGKIWEIVKDE